jgi:MFS family permease
VTSSSPSSSLDSLPRASADAVTSAASARVAWLLFAVAWGTNHFVPLLPLYRGVLGLSPTDLAQIFGIYALGLVPGLLLGGPLSDRIGRRRLVVPAAVIALIGTLILGAGAPVFARLLLGRFVVGVGSGATFSAATAWVQDLAAANGARGAGARRAASALSAGFGGGPLVASVLAQWLPWPLILPYVVQAVLLLVVMLQIARLHLGGPPPSTAASAQAGSVRSLGSTAFVPAGFVRQVLPIAPWVFGLPSISFAVLPGIVAPRLGHFTVVFAGLVTATTLFSGLLAQGPLRALSSQAAGRFGVGAGFIGLVLASLAVHFTAPAAVLLAAAILGTGYGGCLVAGLRFVEANTLPAERGRVTGIFYVLAYLGFAAPLILAALANRHGNVVAVASAAGLAAVSLVIRCLDRAA